MDYIDYCTTFCRANQRYPETNIKDLRMYRRLRPDVIQDLEERNRGYGMTDAEIVMDDEPEE